MSTTHPDGDERVLYLQQIDIETEIARKFQTRLLIDNDNVGIQRNGKTWTPIRSLEIPSPCKIMVIIKSKNKVARINFRKMEERLEISDQEIAQAVWGSNDSNASLSRVIPLNGQPATIVLKFRPSPTFEATVTAVHKLQRAIKDLKHSISNSTLQDIDRVIKYAIAFSEVNPYTKAAFNIINITFELLKEQRKYDEMVSDLAERVRRILPFIKLIQEEDMDDDLELLRGIIKRMYDLILDTADFIGGYVRRSALNRTWKNIISMEDRSMITALGEDMRKLEIDFDRAVGIEALRTAKSNKYMEEDRFLRDRLKPVESGYKQERCCMPETRKNTLHTIFTWALDEITTSNTARVFWLYGIPGVGKTAVASSLCARLHEENRLGGSFFCRRDDPYLGEPKYVLPRLIFELAEMWCPYRKEVIQKLQEDPKLNPDSASRELFLRLLERLQKPPPRPLVVVIDALDECGEPETRKSILKVLFDAASQFSWLRILFTSRLERDIEKFFQTLDTPGSYLSQDLALDGQTHQDITLFAQRRFSSVADRCYLPADWPGQDLLHQIVASANGLFIYVETVWLLVKDESDPKKVLDKSLHETSGNAMGDLYRLYSKAIETRIGKDTEVFRQIIEIIITVASNRPLCDDTLAALAGVEANVVQTLVDSLGSLLYRDNSQKCGIRVRHLSIIDFLVSPRCPPEFYVNLEQANIKVGLACLTTMVDSLKFNICKLETSLLPNSDIGDLDDRIEAHILDQLQYSCLHWANHLCCTPYSANSKVNVILSELFQGARPLYWIEVLSVMGKTTFGVPILRQIIAWAKDTRDRYMQCVEDTLRFLLTFHTPITTSTPHIYTSALAFIPTECELWRNVRGSFKRLMKVEKGRMESWPTRPVRWLGHEGWVLCVAYSPDGLHVVSGSKDNTLRIWDAETGYTVGEPWQGHTNPVWSVAYSPDGRHIVSGSKDSTLRIWDAETGRAIGKPWEGHTDLVSSIAYSPDGLCIVSGSYDNTLRMWDAEKGRAIGEPWRGHTDLVYSVAYSPDGHYVVSGSADNTIRKWDAETGRVIGEPWEGHTDPVRSVAYSPDGRHVVSGSADNTLQMWDAENGRAIGEPWKGHTGLVRSVAYSPDGRYVVSGSWDKTLRIWDTGTGRTIDGPWEGNNALVQSVPYLPDDLHVVSVSWGKTIRTWKAETERAIGEPWRGHTKEISSVAYSPDGRYVVSGSEDNTIRMWDAETGYAIGEPSQGHTDPVWSVAYSPDGRHVISGSWDKTVRKWDAETGRAIGEPWRGHTNPIWNVAYSPDGRYVVSGSEDNTIRMWDAETGSTVGEPWRGHIDSVSCIAYSPDGRYVVSGSRDNTLQIWDARNGRAVGEPWRGHTNSVWSVAYAPNGRYVVSGSRDCTLRIWDTEAGLAIGEPCQGHTSSIWRARYSPDGRHIVSASRDNMLRMWDAETGCTIGKPWKGHTDPVWCFAYSPDSRKVVSGSCDKTVRMWDAETGRAIGGPWRGHTNSVWSVAYSPDGRHVVSGSDDKTIRVWDTSITSVTRPDFVPNADGWVTRPDGGLLFWVPEDCRHGLTCPAILTIPINGPNRVVRLDATDFRYGTLWTEIYEGSE